MCKLFPYHAHTGEVWNASESEYITLRWTVFQKPCRSHQGTRMLRMKANDPKWSRLNNMMERQKVWQLLAFRWPSFKFSIMSRSITVVNFWMWGGAQNKYRLKIAKSFWTCHLVILWTLYNNCCTGKCYLCDIYIFGDIDARKVIWSCGVAV